MLSLPQVMDVGDLESYPADSLPVDTSSIHTSQHLVAKWASSTWIAPSGLFSLTLDGLLKPDCGSHQATMYAVQDRPLVHIIITCKEEGHPPWSSPPQGLSRTALGEEIVIRLLGLIGESDLLYVFQGSEVGFPPPDHPGPVCLGCRTSEAPASDDHGSQSVSGVEIGHQPGYSACQADIE